MVRILHTADLHLDSPFSLKDKSTAQSRRGMLRSTFTSATLFARMEHIDIFLIAGDVFDTQFATRDTLAMMKEEFLKCPDTRFIISPGNHDPYTPDSPWAKAQFPENVYIFSSPEITKFSFPELDTEVYGFAWIGEEMPVSPLTSLPVLDRSMTNILCIHADTAGKEGKYFSLSEGVMAQSGFDYIALGHIHNAPEDVSRVSDTYYSYSGCPEGRSFDECGEKSVIIGEFEKNDGIFTPKFYKKPFTKRHFEIVNTDVTGSETTYDILKRINEAMEPDQNASVRFCLTGKVSPSLILSREAVKENIRGFAYVEIDDRTCPEYGVEALISDPGIRGEFYRIMLPLLSSEDDEERKNAEKALKFGLAALDNAKN